MKPFSPGTKKIRLEGSAPHEKAPNRNKQKNTRKVKVVLFKVLKWTLKVVLLLTLPAAAYFVIDKTPLLKVKTIYVTDFNATELDFLDKEQLKAELLPEVKGKNIFGINLSVLRAKLQKNTQSQLIEHAYFSKLFPDTIKLELVERKPFLSIDTPTECATIDKAGFVIDLIEVVSTTTSQATTTPIASNNGSTTTTNNTSNGATNSTTASNTATTSASTTNTAFKGGNCNASLTKYGAYQFISTKEGMGYKLGKETNAIDTTKMQKLIKVLEATKYDYKYFWSDGFVLQVFLENDAWIKLSFTQSLDTQLKRLILVTDEIESQNIRFKTMDLRYERPAITK
ncbi:MAG: hypothetical protein Fur003_0680 [Candidatus Dojkabacteria bacterium]